MKRGRQRWGSYYAVSEAWKAEIDAELGRRGMTRLALAKAIGCHPSTITNTLRRGPQSQETGRFATKIAEYLGVPLPGLAPEVEAEAEKLLRLKKRNPRIFDGIMRMIDGYLEDDQ